PHAYTRSLALQKSAPNSHLNPHTSPQRRYPQKLAQGKSGKPAPHQESEVNTVAAAAISGYSEIDAAELVLPPGTTTTEQRAFGAIARKHRLTRDELQLLLDELSGMISAKAQVR